MTHISESTFAPSECELPPFKIMVEDVATGLSVLSLSPGEACFLFDSGFVSSSVSCKEPTELSSSSWRLCSSRRVDIAAAAAAR